MAKSKTFKSMDGNEAAAYASYAFTEVATIYPITPSSPMANHVDEWSAHGKKNIFGSQVRLMEMQAESGACAGIQGALEAGSLATADVPHCRPADSCRHARSRPQRCDGFGVHFRRPSGCYGLPADRLGTDRFLQRAGMHGHGSCGTPLRHQGTFAGTAFL